MLLLVALVIGLGAAAWLGLRGLLSPVPTVGCRAVAGGRTVEVTPEQMGNAATITAVAVRRRLPARAATIAVATAMQESKLVNIDYGDRDSLGLFQQRPSQGWGTPEQVRDPVYAANAFYDVLVKVEGYRTMEITEVAQRVQRSAFPRAYADHEPDARVLASALSGQSPAALTCMLDADSHAAGAAGVQPFQRTLRRELTTVRTTALTGVAGVHVPTSGSAATWAAAQWSVAQAERLGVARVYADGKVWRRAAGDAGWAGEPSAASAAPGASAARGVTRLPAWRRDWPSTTTVSPGRSPSSISASPSSICATLTGRASTVWSSLTT
jgi:hypothetical protein